MKPAIKFKCLIVLLILVANVHKLSAQSKNDIFDRNVPVTWLGVDYSLTSFIGTPTNSTVELSAWTLVKTTQGNIVTKDEFRDSYTVQWNQLFIDEPKKYDVAKAINRSSVNYAIDVCINANKKLGKKEFFFNNPGDFHTKTEADVANAVKSYDFQGHSGLGMMFFVEGMNKGGEGEGIWVTFVDMGSKTVLLTKYETAKGGGSGFRNYWAKPMYVMLKEMNLKKWQ